MKREVQANALVAKARSVTAVNFIFCEASGKTNILPPQWLLYICGEQLIMQLRSINAKRCIQPQTTMRYERIIEDP